MQASIGRQILCDKAKQAGFALDKRIQPVFMLELGQPAERAGIGRSGAEDQGPDKLLPAVGF